LKAPKDLTLLIKTELIIGATFLKNHNFIKRLQQIIFYKISKMSFSIYLEMAFIT
jgi:hypothetical protein